MQYSTRKTFTYTWTIQNSAHCWHKEGELLNSPAFFVDTLERTKWYLRIFPRGNFEKGFSTVYLRRDSADFGPDSIKLGYKISFLAENGVPIRTKEIKEHSFTKNHGYGALELLTWDDMFLHQGEVTIRCEMWASEYEISESGHCRATTKIGAVQRSFVWDIKNFSVLGSNRKKSMQMKCISTGASQITFDFCLTEGLGCEENMYMEVTHEDEKIKIIKFSLYLMDVKGRKTECARKEVGFYNPQKKWFAPLFLTKRKLMEKKNLYLKDDTLRLLCECSYSTGTVLEEIENIHYGNTSLSTINAIESDLGTSGETLTSGSSVTDCLRTLYKDQILCDVQLRTNTDIFPCHRSILSARSAVFRTMFSTDMAEKTSEYVDVPDLDDDTVHQMLLYLYTDTMKELDWDSACHLYEVSDKYQLLDLKNKCVIFFKTKMCPSNACEILVLSDLHQDSNLKEFVQGFIVKHWKDIFLSNEWRLLMSTNIQLAAETMHLKCVEE